MSSVVEGLNSVLNVFTNQTPRSPKLYRPLQYLLSDFIYIFIASRTRIIYIDLIF